MQIGKVSPCPTLGRRYLTTKVTPLSERERQLREKGVVLERLRAKFKMAPLDSQEYKYLRGQIKRVTFEIDELSHQKE